MESSGVMRESFSRLFVQQYTLEYESTAVYTAVAAAYVQ